MPGRFPRDGRRIPLGEITGLFQFEIRGREPSPVPCPAADIGHAIAYGTVVCDDAVNPYGAPSIALSSIGFGDISP